MAATVWIVRSTVGVAPAVTGGVYDGVLPRR